MVPLLHVLRIWRRTPQVAVAAGLPPPGGSGGFLISPDGARPLQGTSIRRRREIQVTDDLMTPATVDMVPSDGMMCPIRW